MAKKNKNENEVKKKDENNVTEITINQLVDIADNIANDIQKNTQTPAEAMAIANLVQVNIYTRYLFTLTDDSYVSREEPKDKHPVGTEAG